MEAKLRKLMELVEDRSERGRNLLFRHVCDLFFHGPLPAAEQDRAALFDILKVLRPRIDVSLRRELAGHLYSMERPPEPLLRLLIDDEPSVADLILDFAALPDSLIRHIAATHDQAGDLRAINRLLARRDISPECRTLLTEARDRAEMPPPAPQPPVAEPVTEVAPPQPKVLPPLVPDLIPVKDALDLVSTGQDRLEDFARASSDWLWETDRDGRLVFASASAAAAFGAVSAAALVGQRLRDLVNDGSSSLDARLAAWRPFDGLKLVGHGTGRSWILSGVPAFDLDSGRFLGFRGSATAAVPEARPRASSAARPAPDVPPAAIPATAPEQPVLDAELIQEAGLDQGLADTLQTLSHEIKTPLNAIIGFSELIELGAWGQINDEYKTCLRRIQAAGHQLNEFVSEILEDARIRRSTDAPKFRCVAIAHLVRDAIDAIGRQATVRSISVTAAENPLETIVVTEPQIAERCLVRLIRCAIMDAGDGSALRIETRPAAAGGIDIVIPLPAAAPAAAQDKDAQATTALKALRLVQIRELAARIGAAIRVEAAPHPQSLILHLPNADQHRDGGRSTPAHPARTASNSLVNF